MDKKLETIQSALTKSQEEVAYYKRRLENLRTSWNEMKIDQIVLDLSNQLLTPRENKILEMRLRDKQTLEEVGKHFGVNRQRIRQIESKALARLRKSTQFYKKKIDAAYVRGWNHFLDKMPKRLKDEE